VLVFSVTFRTGWKRISAQSKKVTFSSSYSEYIEILSGSVKFRRIFTDFVVMLMHFQVKFKFLIV
jgi:hypothetical protein